MTALGLLARIPAPIDRADILYASSSSMQDVVGFGRKWSCEALAVATGIPVSTVKSYWSGESPPSLTNFIRIAQALGPEYVNRILEVIDLGGVCPLNAPADSLDLHKIAIGFVSMVAEHLTDDFSPGRIDHRELAAEVPLIRKLHCTSGGVLRGIKKVA